MKTRILFLSVIVQSFAYSQESIAAIELDRSNLLFRGYANKITVAVTDVEMDQISVASDDAIIKKLAAPGAYAIKASKGQTASVHILHNNGNSIDTIKTVEYRLQNLPVPDLYLGRFKTNTKASSQRFVFIKVSSVFDPPSIITD